MTKLISLISGLIFGLGLTISGMVNPEKVLGFLNIFSNSHNPLNISIYDLNGREVMSKKIIFDSVDISNLSQGIYTLTLSDGKKSTVKKIVVK